MTRAPSDRLERHVTCLGCGCLCDDFEVTVRGDQIAGMDHACRARPGFVTAVPQRAPLNPAPE
jgi:formylmethanofuran dehydrogenase subunit B